MNASNFNYQHKPKTLKIAYDRVFYKTVNIRQQAKITQNQLKDLKNDQSIGLK